MSKYLATDEFTIVGVGTTSMYMDSDRGSAAIGTGRINGFLIVPKQAFTMSCYTSVHITVKDAWHSAAIQAITPSLFQR